MPRTRRTLSGAPAQSGPPVAGQTYGNGADQQQLAQALPTPNMQAATPNQAQAAPSPPVAAQPPYDHQAALAAASQLSNQTGLLQTGTERPNEPITAGLTRGPGPGPEAMAMTQGSPVGDMLRRLSASTGDPMFADLARQAGA